jgi:DNA polymerase III delta subunit
MIDEEMRDALKKGTIHYQYLLMGNEPLLIENSIAAIRDALKVDQAFDLDTFFAGDTEIEAIMERFSFSPFASARRLIIVKDIEKLEKSGELKEFADAVNGARAMNCLVMVYTVKKDLKLSRHEALYKKVSACFRQARLVTYKEEKGQVRRWIMTKIRRERLDISPAVIEYVESAFKHDITGLKNEFEKIKNYLNEAKQLGLSEIRDLAVGLCDYDKYHLVNAFLQGKPEALGLFEELKPYVRHYAEIVDALVRGTLYAHEDLRGTEPGTLRTILGEIQNIDRKMKTNTYFEDLHMELFFVQNMTLTRKGGVYGR